MPWFPGGTLLTAAPMRRLFPQRCHNLAPDHGLVDTLDRTVWSGGSPAMLARPNLGYDVSYQRRTNSLPAGNLAGNISNPVALANLSRVIAFCLNGLFENSLLVPGWEFASVASVRQGISIDLTLAVSIILRYLPAPYINN